jgi:hypothetical protein
MKTNDGGVKIMFRERWRERTKSNERENYRKRREAKLIFREGVRGRRISLRTAVRIEG